MNEGMPEDDGQWYSEVGLRELYEHETAQERAKRHEELLEKHRQWVKKFNEKAEQEKAHEMD